MNKIDKKTFTLLGIFITALVLANILGTKITTIFGISVSAGIFAYPLTFLCTDIIEEVRGKKVTKYFIKTGLISLVVTTILILISIKMPAASRYPDNEAFVTVFSSSTRMILASFAAFFFGQIHDIWAFNLLKEKTKKKHLWLRNNLSTIISQLIDTTIFMFIAFYMVTPKFTAPFIIELIIPYWLFKVLFAFIDTPLVYMGVKWLKS
ncbi:MAG: queuosine precursor transporter [Nanobdellota archaeon]